MVGFQYGPDRHNNLGLMLHSKKYLFYFIYQFFVIFIRMILILDAFMTFFFVRRVKRGCEFKNGLIFNSIVSVVMILVK